MEVSTLLREARLRRRETQKQVAGRLGVAQQVVSRVERGGGTLRQIARLCRGLGLELTLKVGDRTVTLVHAIDPDERKEIEANIDWFLRLEPVERLRNAALHQRAAEVLRKAGEAWRRKGSSIR